MRRSCARSWRTCCAGRATPSRRSRDFADVTGQLSRSPFDLVLLDLNLPERISQICRDISSAAPLPVLVLAIARSAARRGARARTRGRRIPHQALERSGCSKALRGGGRICSRGRTLLLDRQTYTPLHPITGPSSCRRIRASCSRRCWRTAADRLKRRPEPRTWGHDGIHRRKRAAGQPHAAEKDDGVPRGMPAARVRARRRLWLRCRMKRNGAICGSTCRGWGCCWGGRSPHCCLAGGTRAFAAMAAVIVLVTVFLFAGVCAVLCARSKRREQAFTAFFWPHRTRHTNRHCAACSPPPNRKAFTCSARRCAPSSRPSRSCRRRWTTTKTTWSSGRTR